MDMELNPNIEIVLLPHSRPGNIYANTDTDIFASIYRPLISVFLFSTLKCAFYEEYKSCFKNEAHFVSCNNLDHY